MRGEELVTIPLSDLVELNERIDQLQADKQRLFDELEAAWNEAETERNRHQFPDLLEYVVEGKDAGPLRTHRRVALRPVKGYAVEMTLGTSGWEDIARWLYPTCQKAAKALFTSAFEAATIPGEPRPQADMLYDAIEDRNREDIIRRAKLDDWRRGL